MRQRRLSDPRDLRALAHPVRIALIEQLVLHGAQTASQLADRIDETPANCSWHLRKLAEHGFVEEAGGGRGRERPWQATSIGMSWGDDEESAESRVAGDALTSMMIEREVVRASEARTRLRGDAPEWLAGAFADQTMLWLTADELAEVDRMIQELFAGKLERHEDPSLRPPGSRLCSLLAWGYPTYGLADPTPEGEPGEER
ncbi:MAG TPA: helix-turn-helix domain-containing protein [Marmoricola sp.]|nr:helix-turn-helix domain-containing protein [Marmoricola sp.]